MEVLMTAPVTDEEVVLAKYIGAVTFYAAMLAPTLIYVGVLFWLSTSTGPDMGAIWSGYLGLVLMAGVFLAGGLLISSLVSDQITAAVLSFVLVVSFFFVLMLRSVVTGIPWLSSFVEYATISSHLEAFSKGIIDSRDVIYFVTLTAFFLYATVKSVESRKWR
jgi:ABC-2 type transport system permease protein